MTHPPPLPTRPRLKPSIDVFTSSDGHVHLFRGGDDDFEIEPEGRPIAALLAALDGSGDLDRLEHRAHEQGLGITGDDLRTIVGQLWDLGVVEDAATDERLGDAGVRRYDRQLRYFGDVAPPGVPRADYQARLECARVVVLGLGGLGGFAAWGLATAGVGTIVGVDGDVVEPSNFNRQVLYREEDLGKGKAETAARAISAFNSGIAFEPVPRMLRGQADVEEVIAGADFVVDAADWPPHEIERWVNAACFSLGVPYLMMSQFPPLARLGPTYVPGTTGCYACQEAGWRASYPLFDELVEHRRRHSSPAASFGPACGLIGSQVAMDVVHHLSGVCPPATLGASLTVDLRTMEITREEVRQLPDCPVCGG
jgi:bacteriocin biosynthesis cyclodehydratase domain-containing protein